MKREMFLKVKITKGKFRKDSSCLLCGKATDICYYVYLTKNKGMETRLQICRECFDRLDKNR